MRSSAEGEPGEGLKNKTHGQKMNGKVRIVIWGHQNGGTYIILSEQNLNLDRHISKLRYMAIQIKA